MDFECSFQCELKDLHPQPAVTLRARTPLRDIIRLFDSGYADIADYLHRRGISPTGPPYALYRSMEGQEVDVEFGYPVPEGTPGHERFSLSSTPGGRAAACLYIGPYDQVAPAYDALMKWIDDNGLQAGGEACEVYLNDPSDVSPEFLKTEVQLLLVP